MPADPCPSTDELDRLIRGRLPAARNSVVTEHVGWCEVCQGRLDTLSAGDPIFTTTIRQQVIDRPPPDSALWPALSAVEAEVSATAVFPRNDDDTAPNAVVKQPLDFLVPCQIPGRIGMLGTFEIVREVGRGGMGVVLEGYDTDLQRSVAIKVLDPQLANNDVARKRFCREARAAALVTHENLVAVHQVNEDMASGLPYLVMQLVVGESLEERLKRDGKMTWMQVARLGEQVAAGLSAAHSKDLIHRDIKPGNILLEKDTDKAKLTDFGLARAAEDVKLTRTGFVAGTPLYMAPEQARGDDIDARADLFSLGSVLYEAAVGNHPFDGKTPLAVLRKVAEDTQPSLRDIVPEFPVWLSDVVDRLMAKKPQDRFATAAEVSTIFRQELAASLEVPGLEAAGVCGVPSTKYALSPRNQICWKSVALRVLPWVGGASIGAMIVGFWPGDPVPDPAPQADPPPVIASAFVPETPPPRVKLVARAGPVWTVGYAPDGNTLAAGYEDGTLRVWDSSGNRILKTLTELGGNLWSVDFSSDGKHLVATCDDSVVKIFNMATLSVEYSLQQPTSTKTAVFSPDGTKLATGDRNATIRVWEAKSKFKERTEFAGHRGTVHGLSFSPDGQHLASAGSDGKVRIWDLTNPKADSVSFGEHEGSVYAVSYSPDRNVPRLASAGWDKTVRIWDPVTGAQLHVLRHDGDVWSVSFGEGGKILASASQDGTVKVWDVATGKELHVFRGSGRPLHTVRFAADGKTFATAGRDGDVRIWKVE